MIKISKKILFPIIFLSGFLVWGNAEADTHTAATCSYDNVNAAITSAETGDTVSIPAGECTWETYVNIPSAKKITLQGSGSSNTVITFSTANALRLNESGSRITGIGFNQSSGTATQNITTQGTGWRIDHCSFTNASASSVTAIYIYGDNITYLPYGLIDNNIFNNGRIDINGMTNFSEAGDEWSADSVLGTANAVYIEDNTFYKHISFTSNVIDANRGVSYVARYNTVSGDTGFMTHSIHSNNQRATKNWEYYGNSFTADDSTYYGIDSRAGTGVIFGNYFSSGMTNPILFDNVRSYAYAGSGDCEPDDCSVVGFCDGSSYIDGNDSSNGWPCRDQIGRGKDISKWSVYTDTPTGQESQPAYSWLNRKVSAIASPTIANNCGAWIQANRDYYTEGASFNGTSGVGCGTLANRPATCVAGVGYWATNQSCTDLTGMVGANPETPIEGTLYKCTDVDTWEEYYMPYTYPHPLRTESSDTTAPASPSGLAVS